MSASFLFFFQAEDGIRYLVRSRGLGDVYKRQTYGDCLRVPASGGLSLLKAKAGVGNLRADVRMVSVSYTHLTLPTSDLV